MNDFDADAFFTETESPIKEFIREIPELTPREMFQKIAEHGYIGQDHARKAVCLMAYRHINRLKKMHLDKVTRAKLPPKDNIMLIGPTGCGKTFLVETLFQKILSLPTVIIDITAYSETGYVGQDVPAILTRLINEGNSMGARELALIGIVCIDEFDKISSGKNNAVFSGAGTTKDVSGLGVQRELLKMLEASDIDVPLEMTHSSYAERITVNTADIPFIACGAFSGFKMVIQEEDASIGFGGKGRKGPRNQIAVAISQEEVEKTVNFQSYGIMPELMGRFSRIVPFHPLSKKDLKAILAQNVLEGYKLELDLAGIELKVSGAVLDHVVELAIRRETGARGVKSALLQHLEEACFEAYSTRKKKQRITLSMRKGEITWDLK